MLEDAGWDEEDGGWTRLGVRNWRVLGCCCSCLRKACCSVEERAGCGLVQGFLVMCVYQSTLHLNGTSSLKVHQSNWFLAPNG